MSSAVISLSDFKAEASRYLRELHEHSKSLVLTQNGRASAVVLDYDTHQRQQEALLMLKLMVQGEDDIANNRLVHQSEVFDVLRDRLGEMKDQHG